MDAMQATTANLQPTAVTTQQPSDPAAASAAIADDATQLPVTFKALLEKLKALKPAHAGAEPGQTADKTGDDTQATKTDETDAVLGTQALLAIAESALPLELVPDASGAAATAALSPESAVAALLPAPASAALLPAPAPVSAALLPAPATVVRTDVAAAASVTEAPRAQVGVPIATAAEDGEAAPQLNAAPATPPQIAAADSAASGEFLPVTADAHRAATRSAATDAQAALQGSAAVQAAAPARVAASPALPAAQISTQVGSAAWGNELGQHMVWMVGQKQHVAELHLNPPHLGPLDITLTIDDKQTTAVFTSPHGAVREAIAAELPRLREVLAESGITLGNTSVTADNPRDGQAYAQQQQQRGLAMAGDATAGMPEAAVTRVVRPLGMVDLFA